MTHPSRRFAVVRLWLLSSMICGIPAGCQHKPSYSDIKVEKGGSLSNANSALPEVRPSLGPADPLGGMPDSSPSADASAGSGSTPPAFFDQKTGQIKNLPLYPGARVRRIQFGPINGTPQVTMQAFSKAPFEKVTAFYEQVVKQNGWTTDDSSRGVNSYIWQLSKGQTDRAAIRVDRAELGRVSIALVRTS